MFNALDIQIKPKLLVALYCFKVRPKAPGKSLSLLPEDEIHKNYRYSPYVTNLGFVAEIRRMYHGRGDAENRIKA